MTGKQFAAWVKAVGGADRARKILGISRATIFRLQTQSRIPRMLRLAIKGVYEPKVATPQ